MSENNNVKIESNFDVDTSDIDHGRVTLSVAKAAIPKKTAEGDLVQLKQAMLTSSDALQIALTAARKAGLHDPSIKQVIVTYVNSKTGSVCRTLAEMQQSNIDLKLVVTVHSDTLATSAMIGDSLIR
jgi:hypothetical protein